MRMLFAYDDFCFANTKIPLRSLPSLAREGFTQKSLNQKVNDVTVIFLNPLDKPRIHAYNMRIILIFAVYYEKRKKHI